MLNEDQDLIRGVADGDRDAFIQLYDRYASRVYGLSLRMLGNSMIAEEITQEAFLKLWTRANTYRSKKGTLLGWLLTITRHIAIDKIRLESRRPDVFESFEEKDWDWLPDPKSTTEEARWRTLRFQLGELPTPQRQVIVLAFYHGLSQQQISEHLDIPLGTVKTRVRLGMNKLREGLVNSTSEQVKRSESGIDDVKYNEGVVK
jgi:RNA polymerase sigma-70 factor (ECF subfamily)